MFSKKTIIAIITLAFVLTIQSYVAKTLSQREAFTDASGNTVATGVTGYAFWNDQNFWIVFVGMGIAFFVVLKVF